MTDTTRFSLPLVSPSQAQKHVTVNEALTRLDAMTQLRLASLTTTTPPVTPVEGDTYGVPGGGVNAWSGQDGQIALFINNGWAFVPPTQGMRAYVQDAGAFALFDGANWQLGMQTLSPHGAGMIQRCIEIDHNVQSGASSSLAAALPSQSVVYGVTGRVLSDITGTATGFSLGVSGSTNRYGSGLSLPQGSWLRGLTGTPTTYYSAEDLILTAEGGDFTGGSIRICIHALQFALPTE